MRSSRSHYYPMGALNRGIIMAIWESLTRSYQMSNDSLSEEEDDNIKPLSETYYDASRQPKSGYAVPERHSKIRQEKIRQDFLKKWEELERKI